MMDNGKQVMFSHIAGKYDFLNHFMSLGFDRGWRRKAVRALPARGKAHVLDLCAGTGDMALAYLETHENGRSILLDFSRDTLMVAEGKLRNRGHSARIELMVGDATRLPFKDKTFPAVLCGFGVRNIEQPVDILLEARRVLRKRGKLTVLEFFRPTSLIKRLFLSTFAALFAPVLGAIFARDFKAYRYLIRSIRENLTLDEFCLLMETVGFKKVVGENIGRGFASIVTGER